MRAGTHRGRLHGWVSHAAPTRDRIERNRLLRPVAHRILAPALWRFTRRSVPRGVALGVFCGVVFPFAHMALAAVLALPARANVPTAVGATLVNNPVTFVPLMAAAYQVGRSALRLGRDVPGHPLAAHVHGNEGWLHWIVAQGGPATITGLLILAVALSALGYAAASLGWRWRTMRKWRNRHAVR